ncbi:heterokaryon incompatibility protein-domain-containing protein, partial [Boeremia exigua]|uniref:heterokaryon incompatibility protein-domain-containing protein n=1 Tax=Boeremia exigua TaxID=749465 RepID=UPI001E8EDB70
MRLLRLGEDGQFTQKEFTGKAIPRYAILSHTWGEDDQEVSFEDVRTGSGNNKAGYVKLQFCAQQAASDGLDYFWIDTCCIDKASSTELSEAINSMFRWYRNADRCYVYLADVTDLDDKFASSSDGLWRYEFQQSKWFTRGWTLQELLAPTSVEFFTAKGKQLGDKHSLFGDIFKATGIPFKAVVDPMSLSLFSVEERLSWAADRDTKREEDAAYALLGLFDLSMPLVYGEGRKRAFNRLHRELQ